MLRLRLIITGFAVTAVLFCIGCAGSGGGNPQEEPIAPSHRVIRPDQLLRLSESRDHPLRLRRDQDVLPGGLAAAMAPMLVDWQTSEVDRPDGFVVVRNLNYGGNPLEGTTVLQTVKIPLDGVERIEWVLVPLKGGDGRGSFHHGQLRFVFRADRPLQLLDLTDEAGGGSTELYDIVASWEAWRPPGVGYDMKAGLDADAYHLTLRLYAGPERFLADALGDRGWYCTPLRLPGGAEGLAEVLKVTLALGDGVARHTISEEFAEAYPDWLADTAADQREELAAQWRELMERAEPRQITDDPRLNLPKEQRSYQTVLRSCASIAYYCVVVAVNRLHERGLSDGVDREHLADVHLGGDQPWMSGVAHANMLGLLVRAPLALGWLIAHPAALPDRIPGQLDKAGLVLRENGEAREIHYSAGGLNPYR